MPPQFQNHGVEMNYLHVEIQRLRDRIAEQDRQIRDLQRELGDDSMPMPEWVPEMTLTERFLLSMLIKNDRVTERKFLVAIGRTDRGPDLYSQYVLRVRRKLREIGIEIHTKWGEGHSLSDRDKARFTSGEWSDAT